MPDQTSTGQPRSAVRTVLRDLYFRLPMTARRRIRALRQRHVAALHALLPLPVPETIHIDPVNLCNFRCTFCPTSDRELLKQIGRPKGMMDPELFRKIVDDLQFMENKYDRRVSVLHLYKDGEPLLHKKLHEMIAYAKQAGVARNVQTTSNGALLSREVADRLIESGLDAIRISVIHVDDSRYSELTQTFGDYAKVLENVSYLYREKERRGGALRVFAKINDSGLSLEQREKFERDFGPNCDMLQVDSMMGWSLSEVKDFTLGVDVSTGMDGVSPIRDRQVCPEPFSRLAVNFDGQVSVCCVDWSFGTIVGDLRTQSLEEIWNGESLRAFRLAHLKGKKESIPACNNCQYVKGMPLSRDLDEHSERLLGLYE